MQKILTFREIGGVVRIFAEILRRFGKLCAYSATQIPGCSVRERNHQNFRRRERSGICKGFSFTAGIAMTKNEADVQGRDGKCFSGACAGFDQMAAGERESERFQRGDQLSHGGFSQAWINPLIRE